VTTSLYDEIRRLYDTAAKLRGKEREVGDRQAKHRNDEQISLD